MDADRFVSAVRETARISTREEAEQAIHATLQVLGQRLTGGETTDLAAQLPEAFAADLPGNGAGERFGVEEFYDRVAAAQGGGTSARDARRNARAVLAALKAAVSDEEFDELAGQLPEDYQDLVGGGPLHH